MQKLINSVQNYAWGSKTALTELYGMENPSSQPMAELWMGAHPKSSSRVHDATGDIVSLRDVIESDKATLLGDAVAKRFASCLSCSKYYAQPAALYSGSSKQTQF
ncbi:mannose-6-phosphate isomerase [Escherichia coli]|uniref:Mannose-6-phosphate isomerase n=1 Tax=Escherichia coli TaxID=562 RepID=A0A484X6L4_ECOLX|nr:mannose-6-phosphate isomerase [Escherichia coli]